MKTTNLNKIVLGTVLALATAAWLPTVSNAEPLGSARGGASLLMREPTGVPEAPKEVVMNCPTCKTDFAVKTDWTARGANKPAIAVEKHLCNKCGTELKLVGVGKHAKDVATHTCLACK